MEQNCSLKVSLFAWRLLNNRLPIKDNLLRQGMTRLDSILCECGCGDTETSNHLFFGFNFFHFLYNKILHWLGVYGQLSNVAGDRASQFCNAHVFRKECVKKKIRKEVRLGLQMERNSRKFAHKDSSVEMLFDKVKRLSW
jgi:hypothetical protein